MSQLYAILNTREVKDKETVGELRLFREDNELFSCVTLELPYRDNERSISCIPPGNYTVEHRYSETYGNHFLVKGVENRSYILIHYGNYYTNTEGCILVGEELKDIDNNGLVDITNSRNTLEDFVNAVPRQESFALRIKRT